jgi:hypothetical protein
MSDSKLQSMIITQLVKNGSVEIFLPDGVVLEVGITQVGRNGEIEKLDDYCWVIASRGDRQASLDKYNLGLRFDDEDHALVMDDRFTDDRGRAVRRLDVV